MRRRWLTAFAMVGFCCCQTLTLSSNFLAAQEADTIAANWHQWRGPDATGVSRTATPPVSWGPNENIKWKSAIEGAGSSTPIVWNDSVFVLSAIDTGRIDANRPAPDPKSRNPAPNRFFQFIAWCFDRETGDVKWKKVCIETVPHEGHHESTTYAAASPVTDGQYLFVSFGSYGIFCLENENGNIIWQRDLGDMRTRRGFGEAISPVLHGDRLIVNWDQEGQSKIFVLDVTNGETVWEKNRDEPTTWATPLVIEFKGQSQLITNGYNRVRSYDLKDGSLVWQTPGTTLNPIPSPIRNGDQVIVMAGFRGNMAYSISLDSVGLVITDKAGPDQAIKWKSTRNTPYVPSPVLIDGRLYFTKSNDGILTCLDAETGETLFGPERLPGIRSIYASPVAADGKIYITSREGVTLVIRSSPKLEILATNRLDGDTDASPALVGSQFFIRSKTELFCIEAE